MAESQISDGDATSDVAAALGIADETVQTLVKPALKKLKLGARNRAHLVAIALRLGLVG